MSNSKRNLFLIILGAVLVVGGILLFTNKNKRDETFDKMSIETNESPVGVTRGNYEAYSPEKIALAKDNKVVIFFHATWCPYCRAVDKDINNNISNIPQGVVILKADYDTQTALKQKYKVTYQHTFVEVDKDGNIVNKWSGTGTLAELISKIK